MAKGKKEAVATIALYGAPHVGHGYIAAARGRMFGDGEPHPAWSLTCALWNAEADLRGAGVVKGLVEITIDVEHRPLMAIAELGRIPAFGDLKWGPGRVYTISAEAILAASEAA